MRKIYFAGSIRGGREDVELYMDIIRHLKNHGQVLTEHIADKDLSLLGEDGLTDLHIHARDMSWLNDSDAIVAEVTQASSGVGYEIGRIVERNIWVSEAERKPILCLYRPQVDKRLSAMVAGSDGLVSVEYNTLEEAKLSIDNFFGRM